MATHPDNLNDLMSAFIQRSIRLAEDLRDESKKAEDLIVQLEKTTNYRAVLLKEAKDADMMLHNGKSFASMVYLWVNNYQILFKDYEKLLSYLIDKLRYAGFEVKRNYPSFTIRFNNQQFMFSHTKNIHSVIRYQLYPIGTTSEMLIKKENKFVQDIAELISLEFHVQEFMRHVSDSISASNVSKKCQDIQSFGRADGNFIDKLHEIIMWWAQTKKTLNELKKVAFTAIQVDKKAAEQIERIMHDTKIELTDEKDIAKMGVVLAKIALNFIPYGGLVSTVMEVYQNKGLFVGASR